MRASRWVVFGVLFASGAIAAPASEWLARVAAEPEQGARIGELDEQSQKLKDQLEDLGREQRENQALTIARGRAYVRLARAGLLPLSEGFDALAAHASRLERLRRSLGRDLERERKLAAQRVQVAHALQDLQNLKPAERDALARARTAVVAAEERDEAFQRAFQSDWNPSQKTAVYGAQSGAAVSGATTGKFTPPAAGGFAAQRGRLPFPLAGRAEIQKVESPTGVGKALSMAAPTGATVRAVYAGHVAFADDYPGLGKTVIVDHGDQYYSISAHLDRISVEVGEEIESGHRIGTVGIYDEKPGLLFEVRSGQNALNTPEWFGI
jgi:septal ring factor EnvC (AmiA/AmiB activator)